MPNPQAGQVTGGLTSELLAMAASALAPEGSSSKQVWQASASHDQAASTSWTGSCASASAAQAEALKAARAAFGLLLG